MASKRVREDDDLSEGKHRRLAGDDHAPPDPVVLDEETTNDVASEYPPPETLVYLRGPCVFRPDDGESEKQVLTLQAMGNMATWHTTLVLNARALPDLCIKFLGPFKETKVCTYGYLETLAAHPIEGVVRYKRGNFTTPVYCSLTALPAKGEFEVLDFMPTDLHHAREVVKASEFLELIYDGVRYFIMDDERFAEIIEEHECI